ncbi:Hypothetical predicted protein [Octopus vulgaris]|uniref:Uncharacterized protein n=1 Tax=Octopus vulgaris TaxID=6645 RepID=A0AA36FMG2_OCTVU|nr:Hypothetical predicted protein [Octopus vulgaris]
MMKLQRSDEEVECGGEKEADFFNQNEEQGKVAGDQNLLSNEKIKDVSRSMENLVEAIEKEDTKSADYQPYGFEPGTHSNQPRENHVQYENAVYDHPFGMEIINLQCVKCGECGYITIDRKCCRYCQNSTVELCQQASSEFPRPSNSKQEDGIPEKTTVVPPRLVEEGNVKREDERDEEVEELVDYSKLHWMKFLLRRHERSLLQMNRLQEVKH